MEIINKRIQESKLILAFDDTIGSNSVVTVGIDNAENYNKNKESGSHDYWYENPTVSDKTIYVDIDSDASALIVITVTIGDKKYVTLFLNRYMLFKAQNKFLSKKDCICNTSSCKDCDEKKYRSELLAILLRTQLLNYAYDNLLINDAINFYVDLTRVLNFNGIVFESIPKFYNNLDNYATVLL